MNKRKVEPELLYDYKWVSDPDIDKSGAKVAYVLKEIATESHAYHTHIRMVSIDGTEDIALTSGERDLEPKWSPDGKQLAFIRVTTGKRELWQLPDLGADPSPLIQVKRGISSWVWSPDGTKIAYTTKVSLDSKMEALSVEEVQKLQQQRGKAYSREAITSEGAGWWDGLYVQLFVYDIETGTTTAIASGCYDVLQPSWSLDSERLSFLVQADKGDPVNEQSLSNGLYVVKLADQAIEQLVDNAYAIQQYSWSVDGASIAFVGHHKQYGSGTQNRLYVVSVYGTHEVTAMSNEDLQLGVYVLNDMTSGAAAYKPIEDNRSDVEAAVSGEASSWFTLASRHGATQVWRWRQGEQGQQLTTNEWVIHQLVASADCSTFVVNAIDTHGPAELYRLDMDTGKTVQLTKWNEQLKAHHQISVPRDFWFVNRVGQKLQGWIMLPSQQEGNDEQIPMVLAIHGGPHAMYTPAYSHEFQALVATGVALLFINPRGSFGYGQDFAKACRGDFGNGDYEDLMDATDAAIERYSILDANRLGVMGGSYGGLMTSWIVGHTNRFKAAVSQRCISNWLSFHGTSDIGNTYTEGMLGARLWEQPEVLWERSPVAHANKVTAPILIMHGEQDMRCPIEQSDQWYANLKRLGKKAKLIRYAGSNHSFQKLGKPSLRIDVLKQVNMWFAHYLRKPINIGIPFAMLLENCRTSGSSDSVIIDCIRTKDFTSIQSKTKEPTMDFVERAHLADELGIDWESVTETGYFLTFLHTNALKRLLNLKYGLEEEKDYSQSHYHLLNVQLAEQQAEELRRLIFVQWTVVKSDSGYRLLHKGFME